MMTLREQMDKRTAVQHKLAVLEYIYEYLDENFISRAGRTDGVKGIRVPDCLQELVPEDCIEEVMKDLSEGPISDLKKELHEIENQPMVVQQGGKK